VKINIFKMMYFYQFKMKSNRTNFELSNKKMRIQKFVFYEEIQTPEERLLHKFHKFSGNFI